MNVLKSLLYHFGLYCFLPKIQVGDCFVSVFRTDGHYYKVTKIRGNIVNLDFVRFADKSTISTSRDKRAIYEFYTKILPPIHIGDIFVFCSGYPDPWNEYSMKYEVVDCREEKVKLKVIFNNVFLGSIVKMDIDRLYFSYIKIN